MNIVCATDDKFVQHCSIMLVSLLINNSDVDIYILTEGLSDMSKEIITSEISRYQGRVHFCLVDSTIVEKFPMPDEQGLKHITRATYYRLLIPSILPESIHKVIYLDCDIIVNGSIEELWNYNLDNYALAAVKQIGYGFEAERLGYPIEYGYFNAGVNVINMDYWRKNKICDRLIQYLSDNYDKIVFHDQDALNAVLFDKTLHVPIKFNMTSAAFFFDMKHRGDSKNGRVINDYKEEKKCAEQYKNTPLVLHYVARPKPWDLNCTHPHYDLYYLYALKTINYSNIKKQSAIIRSLYRVRGLVFDLCSAIKQQYVHTDKTRI